MPGAGMQKASADLILIVVSGDLIQGAGPGSTDPEAEIAAQYVEADDFLRRLAVEFVDGDLNRVVLVPGNHDVSWSRARSAMAPASSVPTESAARHSSPSQVFDGIGPRNRPSRS